MPSYNGQKGFVPMTVSKSMPLLLLLPTLMLLLVACGGGSQPSDSSTAYPTYMPYPTHTPVPPTVTPTPPAIQVLPTSTFTSFSKPAVLATDVPTSVIVEELVDGSYVCHPAAVGPFPGVLYNHGGLGAVVGGDMLGTCRALAEAGYLARSEKRPETMQLTGHLDEVLAALIQLRSHADVDPDRVGEIGFSRGGLLTLQAAVEQPQGIHAVVLMAPAHGKRQLELTLQRVSSIVAPVRVFVSENDLYQADHVQIAHDAEDALKAAGKDVALTIYPPYGDDGHELFFVVQEPYWTGLMEFLSQAIGGSSRGE